MPFRIACRWHGWNMRTRWTLSGGKRNNDHRWYNGIIYRTLGGFYEVCTFHLQPESLTGKDGLTRVTVGPWGFYEVRFFLESWCSHFADGIGSSTEHHFKSESESANRNRLTRLIGASCIGVGITKSGRDVFFPMLSQFQKNPQVLHGLL